MSISPTRMAVHESSMFHLFNMIYPVSVCYLARNKSSWELGGKKGKKVIKKEREKQREKERREGGRKRKR